MEGISFAPRNDPAQLLACPFVKVLYTELPYLPDINKDKILYAVKGKELWAINCSSSRQNHCASLDWVSFFPRKWNGDFKGSTKEDKKLLYPQLKTSTLIC